MKKLIILLAVVTMFSSCAKKENNAKPAKTDIKPLVKKSVSHESNNINWFYNLEKSQIEAKKTGKNIFIHFTGSDWCKWCIKLNDEVYAKTEFSEYAEQNLVMVKFDFPQSAPQSQEVKEYNQQMLKKFGVQGFPTVFVLDADLKLAGRTGYAAGGPVNSVNNLKSMISK